MERKKKEKWRKERKGPSARTSCGHFRVLYRGYAAALFLSSWWRPQTGSPGSKLWRARFTGASRYAIDGRDVLSIGARSGMRAAPAPSAVLSHREAAPYDATLAFGSGRPLSPSYSGSSLDAFGRVIRDPLGDTVRPAAATHRREDGLSAAGFSRSSHLPCGASPSVPQRSFSPGSRSIKCTASVHCARTVRWRGAPFE